MIDAIDADMNARPGPTVGPSAHASLQELDPQ